MTIKTIPQAGIRGETALKEAAAGEFQTIMALVRAALAAKLYPDQADRYVCIEAIFADRVVVSADNGRLISFPYTITDANLVELGAPVEVVENYQPVAAPAAAATGMTEAAGHTGGIFLESKDAAGTRWRIRAIRAGLSGNKNYYPNAVLREALPLFDGARVFAKSDDEHLRGEGKSVRNLIGRLSNPAFVEGSGQDGGEVQADLDLLASAGEFPAKLREAWDRGMSNLFGFSIDARGQSRNDSGRRVAQKISKVNSVDLIIEPGAGGQLINLLEAQGPEEDDDMKLRERMIEAVKAANQGKLPTGLNVDDDAALETAYREALANSGDAGTAKGGNTVTREELAATTRMVEARAHLRAAVAESNLPDKAKDKVRKSFEGRDRFTEADVDQAIEGEREYLATFTESGKPTNVGHLRIEAGETRAQKVAAMLDDFFAAKSGAIHSFKECYALITGDRRVTGQLRDCDSVLLRESLSDAGNLDVVLGDAIQRRMLADYRDIGQYDIWRQLCNVVPLADFRTNHRTRLGGYGDLPTVPKGAGYTELASPSDEEATYAPFKKGGTESIALEDIRNDDVGLIRRIPIKLSRVAKRTLSKFVLDFIRTNPVIYDGLALFHATHGNLGSAALDATSLAARRLAMLKYTENGSGDRIGIGPRSLLVPFDLQQTAADLFNRNTNLDKTFVQTLSLNVIPVWYWTDVTDWSLAADPNDISGLEVGFLDGKEEPELFVQDSPTNGSMFSNDLLTWKIRHIYGGAITDWRQFDKSVVAG